MLSLSTVLDSSRACRLKKEKNRAGGVRSVQSSSVDVPDDDAANGECFPEDILGDYLNSGESTSMCPISPSPFSLVFSSVFLSTAERFSSKPAASSPSCYLFFFFFYNSGIWAATFPTILPKGEGVQRPNGRDFKSVVAKARTRVAGGTAVPPLPPSYEHLVTILLSLPYLLAFSYFSELLHKRFAIC